MATTHRSPPGDLFVPYADRAVAEPEPGPEAPPTRPARPAAGAHIRAAGPRLVAALCVLALAALVVWRVALAGARLPAAVGETQLVDGAAAMVRAPASTGLGSGFGELVARLQLAGYAGLTGAFDRHPDLLGAARELAVVAAAVLLGAAVVVALRSSVRPVAVAVALALTLVCTPAVAALATFGPGLLGAAWLAVGAALALRARPSLRVLGAVAGAVGIATAPVLAVPVAVAVVVLTARRWAPTAEVAAALGSSVLVLAILSPAAATSTVVGADRTVLAVAAAVVVLGGFLLAGLRTPAAATASVLVMAVLPWPGADPAVPALVAATVVLGAALVHELASRAAARPPAARRAALALAVLAAATAGVVSAVVILPGPRPAPRAQMPHAELAAWIVVSTGPDSTVTVPPQLAADLVADGVPADRLGPHGELLVRSGAAHDGSDLAAFGDGPTALHVTPAEPPAPDAVAAEAAARTAAGGQLAGNPNLVAPEGVRVVLRSGGVDSRALVLLAGLAGRGPVEVVDLPGVPGEAAALPRHRITVAGVDGPTLDWLRAQRPPFAPTIAGPAGATTLTWPLPAVPRLLG